MPEVHALLSASSSKQWLNCPPSARLQENFPNESSVYAEEGTFAHSIGLPDLFFNLLLTLFLVYPVQIPHHHSDIMPMTSTAPQRASRSF